MGWVTGANGTLLKTTDGGDTWTADRGRRGDVGESRGHHTYTTDGGKRWASLAMRFPAPVKAFSLPTTQRGYVVGDHGMIYRYRIVPIDYTAKGTLEAPAMPAP